MVNVMDLGQGQTPSQVPDNAVPLQSGERPPQGARVVEGPRGGKYYLPTGGGGAAESQQRPQLTPKQEEEMAERQFASDIHSNWKTMSDEEKLAAGNVSAINEQMSNALSEMRTHEPEVIPLDENAYGGDASAVIATNLKSRLGTYSARLPEDVSERLDTELKNMLTELSESNFPYSGNPKDVEDYMTLALDATVYQEEQTWKRQLGDHGSRHIFDDLDTGRDMLNSIMDTIGHVTKDDIAMFGAAAVFHDIGYTADAARLTIDATSYHSEYGQEYIKQNRDVFDKMFGPERTDKLMEMIDHHQDSDIDWIKDPVGTTLKAADNLGLFSPEKLPALFKYVPGANDILEKIHTGFLNSSGPEDFDTNKQSLRDLVEKSDLRPNIKTDLQSAVDEISPLSGKFTLGMFAGEKLRPSFDGETMHVPVKYSSQMKRLQELFNMGQQQFTKLCDSYGATPDQFRKGEVTFHGRGGNLHVKVVGVPQEDQYLFNSIMKMLSRLDKHKPGGFDHDQTEHGNWRRGKIFRSVLAGGGYVHNGREMRPIHKGLIVSISAFEEDISLELWNTMTTISRIKTIFKYWKSHSALIMDNPNEFTLGLWADTEANKISLAVTRIFRDHQSAQSFATKQGQTTYYDLDAEKEIKFNGKTWEPKEETQ